MISTAALVQGVIAGVGVALPLGAISVLLLHEAFTRGWRPAAAGATGVALVDLTYAAAAVLAGAAVAALLAGHERAVHVIGAIVLAWVALRGLVALRGAAAAGIVADDAATRGERGVRGVRGVFGRFVMLTAVNPLTAVYFTVLATGLAVTGVRAGTAFAVGVFLGSWAWQLTLVTIGAVVGERLPLRVRTAVSAAGYAIVLGYAVRLAVS